MKKGIRFSLSDLLTAEKKEKNNCSWVPNLNSESSCEDAELIHEAAIGKIASEQLMKLMSLGLTEKEAEETILKGFLK